MNALVRTEIPLLSKTSLANLALKWSLASMTSFMCLCHVSIYGYWSILVDILSSFRVVRMPSNRLEIYRPCVSSAMVAFISRWETYMRLCTRMSTHMNLEVSPLRKALATIGNHTSISLLDFVNLNDISDDNSKNI